MKKLLIITFITLTSVLAVYPQNSNYETEPAKENTSVLKLSPIFFDEVMFSGNINLIGLGNKIYSHYPGFGITLNKVAWHSHRFNFVFGLDYNITNLRIKDSYPHHLDKRNINFSYRTIGIPLLCRYNFTNNINLFVEAGAFFDYSKYLSKMTYEISSNQTSSQEGTDDVYTKQSSSLRGVKFIGPQIGVGCKIPISGYLLMIKLDYKHDIMKSIHQAKENNNPHSGMYYYSSLVNSSYLRLSVGVGL